MELNRKMKGNMNVYLYTPISQKKNENMKFLKL